MNNGKYLLVFFFAFCRYVKNPANRGKYEDLFGVESFQ